ncbi:hypothetical protein MJI20_31085, partial [Salmonella enterica subsp. enterica serovar Anatum]|nr:hypothetical protein [Salmonella enterica subsp. enterica serovar Anatum]
FGLILFVYTIGIQVGPGFFASLRVSGLRLNLFAVLIVIMGGFTGALLLGLFIRTQLATSRPMIDMRLFTHRIILSGVVMAMTA